MTSANLVRALAGLVGAEVIAPIVREAVELPADERIPMLESVYEAALLDSMSADLITDDDPHEPEKWPVRDAA
jgi:hypothetical protein